MGCAGSKPKDHRSDAKVRKHQSPRRGNTNDRREPSVSVAPSTSTEGATTATTTIFVEDQFSPSSSDVDLERWFQKEKLKIEMKKLQAQTKKNSCNQRDGTSGDHCTVGGDDSPLPNATPTGKDACRRRFSPRGSNRVSRKRHSVDAATFKGSAGGNPHHTHEEHSGCPPVPITAATSQNNSTIIPSYFLESSRAGSVTSDTVASYRFPYSSSNSSHQTVMSSSSLCDSTNFTSFQSSGPPVGCSGNTSYTSPLLGSSAGVHGGGIIKAQSRNPFLPPLTTIAAQHQTQQPILSQSSTLRSVSPSDLASAGHRASTASYQQRQYTAAFSDFPVSSLGVHPHHQQPGAVAISSEDMLEQSSLSALSVSTYAASNEESSNGLHSASVGESPKQAAKALDARHDPCFLPPSPPKGAVPIPQQQTHHRASPPIHFLPTRPDLKNLSLSNNKTLILGKQSQTQVFHGGAVGDSSSGSFREAGGGGATHSHGSGHGEPTENLSSASASVFSFNSTTSSVVLSCSSKRPSEMSTSITSINGSAIKKEVENSHNPAAVTTVLRPPLVQHHQQQCRHVTTRPRAGSSSSTTSSSATATSLQSSPSHGLRRHNPSPETPVSLGRRSNLHFTGVL